MNLHLGAAVAEPRARPRDRSRHVTVGEQPLVELRRRHVREHRAIGEDRLPVGELDPDGLPALHEHALDVAAGLAHAALIADQAHERVDEARTAAARIGIPPSWIATAITCVM